MTGENVLKSSATASLRERFVVLPLVGEIAIFFYIARRIRDFIREFVPRNC